LSTHVMVWSIAGSSSAMTMRALAIARRDLGVACGGHRVEGVHELDSGSAFKGEPRTSGTPWVVHMASPAVEPLSHCAGAF
jgi:hypothetical protein